MIKPAANHRSDFQNNYMFFDHYLRIRYIIKIDYKRFHFVQLELFIFGKLKNINITMLLQLITCVMYLPLTVSQKVRRSPSTRDLPYFTLTLKTIIMQSLQKPLFTEHLHTWLCLLTIYSLLLRKQN